MMNKAKRFIVSKQLMVALALIFGASITAQAYKAPITSHKKKTKRFRVENCGCFGKINNELLFFGDSDIGEVLASGEGKSLDEAKQRAQGMCVNAYKEVFRGVAGDPESVTESDCESFVEKPNGEWASL